MARLPLSSILLTLLMLAVSPAAPAATPEEVKFFETEVRPLLAKRCFSCHGEEKQKGGLRLDSLATILRGGESGPAIAPGKPDESLLVEAINYESFEMPPKEQLPADEIATLTRWVRLGAPWPGAERDAAARQAPDKITAEDRAFWSFQPVREVTPPELEDDAWCRNDVDRFVLRRLRGQRLVPAPEASRQVLIRRLYFDLTGLPPTPAEVAAFADDPSPAAYEDLVDRLLDSPRYGERFARMWLDLVRYAESDGYKQDAYRPHAWRYRDYVIRAFNNDKPYDRFVMEQLAGDEMAPGDLDALTATAYLRHWIYEYNQRDVRTQWSIILDDVTDVTAEVFLGVGLACARCHDHKFDPILRQDYYRFRSFFAPLVPRDDIPFADAERVAAYDQQLADWEEKTADLRRQLAELERPFRERAASGAINKFPPDIRPMVRKEAEQRTPLEQQLVELVQRQVQEEYDKLDVAGKLKGEQKERYQELQRQLKEFDDLRPAPLPPAFTVSDIGPVAPVTYVPGQRAQETAPGYLTILDAGEAVIEPPAAVSNSTGRRTALARWITDPANPLTSRVIVNRVWQVHFGRGIVGTSSDFGRLGERPSHPDLLDWLARRFVDDGWSLKNLHRLLVTSAAYRQSSSSSYELQLAAGGASPGEAASVNPRLVDPDNRLLWRMPLRRLEAEQIRDAVLAVTGELSLQMNTPSVDAQQPRRSIYMKIIRNRRDPLMAAFDAPDGFGSTSERNVTTTPTQALLMINGDWTLARARAFAERLRSEHGGDGPALVERAFRLAYGRPPADAQREAAVRFLNKQQEAARQDAQEDPDLVALTDFCHVLLNSNEFLYVD